MLRSSMCSAVSGPAISALLRIGNSRAARLVSRSAALSSSLGSPVGKRPTARNLDFFTLPVGSAALAHQGACIALEADKRNLERIVLRIAAIAEIDPIASCDALGQADLVSRAGSEEKIGRAS